MLPILLNAFNQGGISDSKYSGTALSHARMIGWNIHGNPGILETNQAMAKISGSTVTEFCEAVVTGSNNIRYWFSSTSGKVWQEKAGAFTLVYTISPAAGTAGCLDAQEYQGYIYIATQSRLHRIPISGADGSAAWTANAVPNWATFSNTDAAYHPMVEVNLVLYIGDKNYVAQVDGGIFSPSALDVESQYRISALGKFGTDLLVGTIISSSVSRCEIFRWNTWSYSFTNADTIYEPGINCFLQSDNYFIVNAGLAGNLYSYNGQTLSFFKKIPGTYSPTKQAIIYPRATDILNGFLPIFGISNVQGNPCDQGIWSFGGYAGGYPKVLNLEFPTSNVDGDNINIVAGIQIGAIAVVGQDVYASWAYNGAYGVDELDYTTKILHPVLETRIMNPGQRVGRITYHGHSITFNQILVSYEDALPANTTITVKYGINGAAPTTNTDMVVIPNSDLNQFEINQSKLNARTLQLRIEGTSYQNTAPKIQEIIIEHE